MRLEAEEMIPPAPDEVEENEEKTEEGGVI
jgi:hypothetical protein